MPVPRNNYAKSAAFKTLGVLSSVCHKCYRGTAIGFCAGSVCAVKMRPSTDETHGICARPYAVVEHSRLSARRYQSDAIPVIGEF